MEDRGVKQSGCGNRGRVGRVDPERGTATGKRRAFHSIDK